jgi:hypothetical protein
MSCNSHALVEDGATGVLLALVLQFDRLLG